MTFKVSEHKTAFFIISFFLFLIMLRIDFTRSALFSSETIFAVLVYIPGFFILSGLIEAWLPTKLVSRYLGSKSGSKGAFYSFIIGSLMVAPLYMAFPLVNVLQKKGISNFNLTLFISTWSVFQLSHEIFEVQFMGARFFILRVLLSIPFVILTSYIISKYFMASGKGLGDKAISPQKAGT